MKAYSNIDKTIADIELRIEALVTERNRLQKIRRNSLLSKQVKVKIQARVGSTEKYNTLSIATDYLLGRSEEKKTKNILGYIKTVDGTNVNDTTIRSHLRRLRIEGHLAYDEKTKEWSTPYKTN